MTTVKDDIPTDVSKLKISSTEAAGNSASHKAPSTNSVSIPVTDTINCSSSGSLANDNRPMASKRRRSSAAAVNFRRPSSGNLFQGAIPSSPSRPPLKKEKKRKSVAPSYEISEPKAPSNGSIKFTTFQQYLLHALDIDNNTPQSVFKINNRKSIEKVVVLVIPNLDINSLGYIDNENVFVVDGDDKKETEAINENINCITKVKAIPELQFFNEQFADCILMRSPGSKDQIFPLTKALLTRQFTKNEKKKLKDELSKKKLVLPDLLMTYDEFIANGYPIHPDIKDIREVVPLSEGWKDTFKFQHDGSHTFALDCEMCETANGKVLTRISMIDFTGENIIDELVKPDEPITDYLTAYSGITEEMLKDVTTTLQEIQEKILGIVSSEDILIGHSLENDLKVMKIRHPKIIDTALVFEHPRGPPFKSSLKYLTKQFLGKTIQEGSHDSIIDSVSCLDLVKLKLVEGALLGKTIDGELIFNDLDKLGKSGVVIDYHRVQPGQERYIQVSSDEESLRKVLELIPEKQLIIAHWKDFEFKKDEEKTELAKTLNQRLNTLYTNLPSNTLLHILTATRDQTQLNELMQRKRAFNREYATKKFSEIESSWSTQDEEDLKLCVLKTRMGLLFGKVKDEDHQIGVVGKNDVLF